MMVGVAHHHALRALQHFVSDDHHELHDAAISAGVALELMCKAAIAQVEPVLLADRTERDTLLRLSGKASHASKRATRIRTIGAAEAFLGVRHFHKSIGVAEAAAREVFETRNAAAHVGVVDRAEVRSATSTMSRAVDAILLAMGADRLGFWGNRIDLVDGIIREQRETVEQIVAAKFAAARARVAALTHGLDPQVQRLVLAARAMKTVFSSHEEPIECPGCGQQAWLICRVEGGEIDGGPTPFGLLGTARASAFPFGLACSVCDLSLDEPELAHLSLDEEIELEYEVEPADFEPNDDQATIFVD
jgi:imidazoleglycerol phosphate dehydratase HisB